MRFEKGKFGLSPIDEECKDCKKKMKKIYEEDIKDLNIDLEGVIEDDNPEVIEDIEEVIEEPTKDKKKKK